MKQLPKASSQEAATNGFTDWNRAVERIDDEEQRAGALALTEDEGVRALMNAVFGNSPYLTSLINGDPLVLLRILRDGLDPFLQQELAAISLEETQDLKEPDLSHKLRVAKKRVALATALADISGVWPLETVTKTLTDFADVTLDSVLAHLLRKHVDRGNIQPEDASNVLKNCGYSIIAMSKYGAGELNYSSDIDIIVLYDPAKINYNGRKELPDIMVRITRDLVKLMEERNGSGYVFRTDLRLRPDPSATPLAISYNAAISYYESTGQNWERAAMIKARACAGDRALGEEFLTEMVPFVWRKHLDFWAIQDVHSIMRQIHAHKGGTRITVEGHNVKLGRGGIRQIEFYAQTQQLIFGGRDPFLREPRTLIALPRLAERERISTTAAEELALSYRFLRNLEHRIQMVADHQTHSLPETAGGVAAMACFMGYDHEEDFRKDLREHLNRVEKLYAKVFEGQPSLSSAGNLVFTGSDPDPDTMKTLNQMGYMDGEAVFHIVRGWHHGRYRCTKSARSRGILTELMPHILEGISKTPSPDHTILRFDKFLSVQQAGVQLFSLLHQNPHLLDMLTEIIGLAPALGERLGRHSNLLESFLEYDFLSQVPDRNSLRDELKKNLSDARDYQDVLDLTRHWAQDRRFQVGVQILQGRVNFDQAGRALSDIADTCISHFLEAAHEELARNHGHIPGPGMAVMALGKLGAGEMAVGSDLDLVFVFESENQSSDGRKPLDPGLYHARLSQRLVTALTTMTSQGELYEVDLRLRPSGNDGTMAPSLNGFQKYYATNADTWEFMALSKARIISADPGLREKMEKTIKDLLCQERDGNRLLHDVATMREKIHKSFPGTDCWDIKYRRGGLYDLDFLAQYLQLRHAHEHPEILSTSSQEAFRKLAKAELLDPVTAEQLYQSTRTWRHMQGLMRLTMGLHGSTKPDDIPPGVRAVLVRASKADSFEELSAHLEETAAYVVSVFDQMITGPAGHLECRKLDSSETA